LFELILEQQDSPHPNGMFFVSTASEFPHLNNEEQLHEWLSTETSNQ
jgi:hypothetical protein